jgi:glycosyltransferase involved in cell wall biosynthesis
MLISIITPTFNSAQSIRRNIQSVVPQTCQKYEHIIVDNLSPDNTLTIARNLYKEAGLENKLKIISEKDEGISDAFNKGIIAANGDIIGILNSDDAYYNNLVFQKVVKAFENPDVLFVHGDIYFDDPDYGSNIRKPLLCPITEAMPYNHPSMFFRKNVYEKHGIFNTKYRFAMDYELIIRYEKLINNFTGKGEYLQGEPLAVMYSGGNSWKYELKAIKESRIALKEHGYWNFNAKKSYFLRVERTRLKEILNFLGLNQLVKLWRNRKWKS